MLRFSKIGKLLLQKTIYFCFMNVKANTLNHYYERINHVVSYINNHLGEKLDIAKLAELGNYSTFHFHRIMHAYLGESLGAYIVRQRLEAAINLLRFSNEPINDIAFKVGYENPSSFNKAFKKRFEVAPADYRKNKELMMGLSKNRLNNDTMENLKSLQPKIKNLKPQKVIYVRALGDYNQSAGKAWKVICDFAEKNRLFGFKSEFIGISHGDPNITVSDKLQYDACITISKDVKTQGEVGKQNVAGGKYAVFIHRGPYNKLKSSYDYIFGKWLAESSENLRHIPCYEKYLNDVNHTPPEKLKTEIYIPIQ